MREEIICFRQTERRIDDTKIYMWIKKAFDTIDHNVLVKK